MPEELRPSFAVLDPVCVIHIHRNQTEVAESICQKVEKRECGEVCTGFRIFNEKNIDRAALASIIDMLRRLGFQVY